jgi:hypothetical protein
VDYLTSLSACFLLEGAVTLGALGTSATRGCVVPAPDDDGECGAVGGVRIGKGNRSTR